MARDRNRQERSSGRSTKAAVVIPPRLKRPCTPRRRDIVAAEELFSYLLQRQAYATLIDFIITIDGPQPRRRPPGRVRE